MFLRKAESGFVAMLKRVILSAPEGRGYYCPLCNGWYRRFYYYGVTPRRDAMCPGCLALERHRLLWLALQLYTSFGGRLLHVAPEGSLARRLSAHFDYVSIDIAPGRGMYSMDVTRLAFADCSFDAIICNHVLEHVQDDRRAIAELHRVLKPGGWASIQVPMAGDTTVEGDADIDVPERIRLFGQDDHVRQYGQDFSERLREGGFDIQVLVKEDLAGEEMLRRLSVETEEHVWLAFKRAA